MIRKFAEKWEFRFAVFQKTGRNSRIAKAYFAPCKVYVNWYIFWKLKVRSTEPDIEKHLKLSTFVIY